jgi:hypothetical protein
MEALTSKRLTKHRIKRIKMKRSIKVSLGRIKTMEKKRPRES